MSGVISFIDPVPFVVKDHGRTTIHVGRFYAASQLIVSRDLKLTQEPVHKDTQGQGFRSIHNGVR